MPQNRSNKHRQLPDHIPGTMREWKVRKRREWKAVLKAIESFRMGVFYTPAASKQHFNGPFERFDKEAKDITERLSVKWWGR